MTKHTKLVYMAIISAAFTAHCSTGVDTETYGTTSGAASSTGPMVNQPEKDAGSDADSDAAGSGCPDCALLDLRPKDCCEWRCVDSACVCEPRASGSICDDGYGEGLCDSARGCVLLDGGVSVCGCP